MADENAIMRDALLTIRSGLDARNIPLKVCAAKAGVSYSTFLSWFPASGTPQIPSLAALRGLAKALPGDLLSLLIADGFHIVPDPEGLDYDEFAAKCRTFIDVKDRAHHPDSPAGRDLSDCEQAKLRGLVVHLPIVSGKAA